MFNSQTVILFLGMLVFLFSQNSDTSYCQSVDVYETNTEIKDDQKNVRIEKGFEYYLVRFDKLEVMNSPSSYASIIGTLAKGDTVKSIGFTTSTDKYNLVSKLVKFIYQNQVGYVKSKYLKRIVRYSTNGEKPDKISIYAGVILVASVIFLGIYAQ
jgi:hypothetical protein